MGHEISDPDIERSSDCGDRKVRSQKEKIEKYDGGRSRKYL